MRRNPTEKKWQCHNQMVKTHLDYFTKKGAIFPMKDGYRSFFKKIEGGGGYALLLKSLNKVEGVQNQIFYLGTQIWCNTPQWWESLVDNFRPIVGELGVKETYYDLQEFLTDTTAGFIDKEGELNEFLGYSLGEVQAARAFILFLDNASRLEGLSGAGVEKELINYYSTHTENSPIKRKIRYTYEGPSQDGKDSWDTHPFLGDGKIGLNTNPKTTDVKCRILRPIYSGKKPVLKEIPQFPRSPKNQYLSRLSYFLCLKSSHTRQTVKMKHQEIVVTNRTAPSRILINNNILNNENLGWEKHRIKIFPKNESFIDFINKIHSR